MAARKPKTIPPVPWRNRIVGADMVPPEQLLAHPKNWRVHPTRQQEALHGVLNEIGWLQDIVVNQTTGMVVDGHLRVMLALRHEQPLVPVKYVELTEEQEALALATFDTITMAADTDREKYAALLQDTKTGDTAVQQFLSELAEEYGLYPDGPPSLDALETQYGPHQDEALWPTIRLRVPPEVHSQYVALMQQAPGDTEAAQFAALLAAAAIASWAA